MPLSVSKQVHMTRGDVRALDRLANSDRRADRATRRLGAALSKSRRNKRRTYATVHGPRHHALSFSTNSHIMVRGCLQTARRRLLRKREGERRAFAVGDVVRGFEEVVALVVLPKRAGATPECLAALVTATATATAHLSERRVLLFSASVDAPPIVTGPTEGRSVFVRKAVVPNGGTFYHLSAEPEGPSVLPYGLQMDKCTYLRVQGVAAELLGAHLVPCTEPR